MHGSMCIWPFLGKPFEIVSMTQESRICEVCDTNVKAGRLDGTAYK